MAQVSASDAIAKALSVVEGELEASAHHAERAHLETARTLLVDARTHVEQAPAAAAAFDEAAAHEARIREAREIIAGS